MYLIILITALLPAAILGWWIYRKDAVRPEPLKQLFSAFLYGVGSAFVAMVLAVPLTLMLGFDNIENLNTIGDALSLSLLSAAVPEEIAKLTMLWLFLRKNPYYDEYLDGIVYAACVGLGFAGTENLLYLLQSEDWITVGVVRSITAVPAHFAIACAMGYYYSKRHFGDKSTLTRICILAVPIIMHWIYDALAFSSAVVPAWSLLVDALFIGLVVYLYKSTMRRIDALRKQDLANMPPPPFDSPPPPLPPGV